VLALIGWLIHIFTGGAARPARLQTEVAS
jgi:hypothetical protein